MSPVRNIAIVSILGIAFLFVILSALQFILSLVKNKWAGFILPIISFLFSITVTLGAVMNHDRRFLAAVLIFVLCNIPTAVFTVIYLALGKRRKNISPIDKMNIQDL